MKVIFDFDKFQKTELASSKEKGYLGIAFLIAGQIAKGVYPSSDKELLIRAHWQSGMCSFNRASEAALSWLELFIENYCVVENDMIVGFTCDWLYTQE